MTTDRLHLQPKHRRILEELLQEHLPEVEVWAYGSRITGCSHDGSDLDLVLRGPDLKKIPIENLTDFEEVLRESPIPFLVEARDWARLPERFHREIERDYVVLYKNAWTTATIDDISEKVAMGPFGSSIKVSTFVPEGIPIISGQHLHSIRVNDSPGFNFISLEHAQRLSNANVQRGDVIFTHAGNIGQVAYIPDRSKFDRYIISQRQFYMRCDPSKVIPEFVALYFKSPEGQHQLLANAAQVGVPSIAQPVTYLRTIEIPIPPIPEQRAIAHILGTLDDKIELNQHMNEALEEIARTLFKSWFVDFEPVRAKMEGRDTGLPKHIADLFPDRMVDSELGEIPEGWAIGHIADIATAPRRGVNPIDLHKDTPYIGLEHMPRYSIALLDWGTVRNVTSQKSIFEKGDILFGKLRPYFHKVGIAPINGVCSTDIVVIVPKSEELFAYLLACVSSPEFVAHADQTSTGTKMPRTSWKVISEYKLCMPTTQVVQVFQKSARPMLEQIIHNIQESHILTSLRNTLLPKLVSGELRIRTHVDHLISNEVEGCRF